MNWPSSQDFNEALQNASSSFVDPVLKNGAATLNSLGLPVPRSGNFADVYQFKGDDGKMWAVKCFTRKVEGLQDRYLKIDEHLTRARLPFTVGFKFFEQGIRVRGHWYPLLKMEWVEGFTLNEFVRNNAGKPQYLHALVQMWAKLTGRLRNANFAHADLQHGNVLLVPADSQKKLGLKLIDYDGMWVPALADRHSGEIGHPNFQHPLRLKERLYNSDVDRFPHLVVASALRATLIGGRAVWDQFDNGDNLLFKESDLRNPAGAPVYRTLWNFHDDVLCTLVGTLALASREPLRKTPWLDDLLLAEGGARLAADDEKKVVELLGVAPHFTARRAAPAVLPSAAREAFSDFNFNDDTGEQPIARPLPRSSRKALRSAEKSRAAYFIGGSIAACAIIIAIALAGRHGDKDTSTQNEFAGDEKTGESITGNPTDLAQAGKVEKTKVELTPATKTLANGKKNDAAAIGNEPIAEAGRLPETHLDPGAKGGAGFTDPKNDPPAGGAAGAAGPLEKAARNAEFRTRSAPTQLAAIPESSALLYACRDDPVLYGITESGETVELGRHDAPIRALCCSANGRWAVSGGDDGIVRVWSVGPAPPNDALMGPHGPHVKFSSFRHPYGIERYQGGVIAFDEESGAKQVVHSGKPGHRALLGFKKNLDQNPDLAQSLGTAVTDEVRLFDGALIVQLFERGTMLCEIGSGKIAWAKNPPGRQPARPPALSQFKAVHSLKKHTGPVLACSVSPDGERLVSVGADSLLCEWNIETGKLIHSFPVPAPLAAAYLPDGKSVLLGTSGESASIVDLEMEKTIRTLGGNQGKVRAVCVSASGKHAYIGGDDGRIRVWSLPTGTPIRTLSRHTSPIVSLAVMFNGEFVVSADSGGHFCLWDGERFLGRMAGQGFVGREIFSAVFNELSDALILGTADSVRRVPLEIAGEPPVARTDLPTTGPKVPVKRPDPDVTDTPQAISADLTDRVVDCLFSSDGKKIYALTDDGSLHVLDSTTLEETQKKKIVVDGIVHAVIAAKPPGAPRECLYVLDSAKRVHTFDLELGKIVKTFSLEGKLNDENVPLRYVLSLAPDNRVLFILSKSGAHGAMLNMTTGQDFPVTNLQLAPFKTTTHTVAFSTDGRIGAAATPFKLLVWRTNTAESLRLADYRFTAQLAVVSQANVVAIAGQQVLVGFDYINNKELWSEPNPVRFMGLQAIPKSKRIVDSTANEITIRECLTGKPVQGWHVPLNGGFVAVASDGKTLVSFGSSDRKVRLWSIPPAQPAKGKP